MPPTKPELSIALLMGVGLVKHLLHRHGYPPDEVTHTPCNRINLFYGSVSSVLYVSGAAQIQVAYSPYQGQYQVGAIWSVTQKSKWPEPFESRDIPISDVIPFDDWEILMGMSAQLHELYFSADGDGAQQANEIIRCMIPGCDEWCLSDDLFDFLSIPSRGRDGGGS